jgi:lysozyme
MSFWCQNNGKDLAEHFLETVGDSSKVLLALDIEENTNNITPQQAEDFVTEVINVTGRLPLIYGSSYFLKILPHQL